MRSVEEARDAIQVGVRLTGVEQIPVDRCLGRVLADRFVTAEIDVPPFANSSMDGFALRADDAPGALRIGGEVAAGGGALRPVEAGTAVRIMTGAPLPPGADAVVPLEEVSEMDGQVRVPDVASGAYVRAAGHDTRAGERLELPAAPLSPAVIGVLASLGHGAVMVRQRPVVAILSTGDELVDAGTPLAPGQIHDANAPALAAAVAEAGGQPLLLERVGDDLADTERRLRAGAAEADLLVVSGGVSVGRYDHVRVALERLGTLELWRIAVQPGKPLAFGRIGATPVLGLPGNPVSALVTFELFGRPLVRAMLGLPGDGRPRLAARAAERMAKDPPRRAYLRVRLEPGPDGYVASAAGGQASSQLRPLAAANALLIVPEGLPAAEAGERYEALVVGDVA